MSGYRNKEDRFVDNMRDKGPLHDRCPNCGNFAIMVDHYEEYICVSCYVRKFDSISTNKDRKEVDSNGSFRISTEPLKELLRQQTIEIWD